MAQNKNSDVPTHDFFKDLNLDDQGELNEALEQLIFEIKSGYFLCWEAVVREEQGLPLSKTQKEALVNLISFHNENDERILYIDELPRPSEPWYEIAKKIVPRLFKEPFRTDTIYYEAILEGWPTLVEVLEIDGQNLSLPEGVKSPLEIFPLDLQHRLNLQICFVELYGLGQDEGLTLENEEQQDCIEDFISALREYKDSVQYFNLSLKKLLKKVIMPPKDEEIFINMMMEHLGMSSPQESLVKFLEDANFSVISFKA
jgi:hypothetical protein